MRVAARRETAAGREQILGRQGAVKVIDVE